MQHYKALIMVISGGGGVYDELHTTIRDTWGKHAPKDCKVLYYYGYKDGYPIPAPNTAMQHGDDIIVCGNVDNWHNQLLETLVAYDYILKNYSFDYSFRCCSGSYVHLESLMNFLMDKPKQNFYCGIPGDGLVYASGSGYFASRDVVQLMVDNKDAILADYAIQPHKHEDVQTGRFLGSKGIHVNLSARRIDGPFPANAPENYHWHICKRPDQMRDIYKAIHGCV